jgi:cytochrome c peroxidase
MLHAQSRGGYGTTHLWWDAGFDGVLAWNETYDDETGQVEIANSKGSVWTKDHPFFMALGSNGRACVTCHQPSNAMSVAASTIRARWDATEGHDPLFAAVDGSNCPSLDQNLKTSHSLLLDRGLFRIALPWPAKDADFRIEVVSDPTGCQRSGEISVYRRPRVAANLVNLVNGPEGAVLMADGREPSLASQATTALAVHEQSSSAPSTDELRRILDFETQLFTAQASDERGGLLNEADAPTLLGAGRSDSWAPDSAAWLTFAAWGKSKSGLQQEFRASVARGSELFAQHKFQVNGAARSCASCHADGTTRWMNIGTTSRDSAPLPLFKVTCQSGRVIYTHDPGRGSISGKCEDVGAIVMPQFHGLAARAPYFSNGSAATLSDVVDYYNGHFQAGFTAQEKRDLVNFLRVL